MFVVLVVGDDHPDVTNQVDRAADQGRDILEQGKIQLENVSGAAATALQWQH